jgi:glutathione peroxidase
MIKYQDKSFTILGFPCNQFGGQEPLSNSKIQEFISSNYNINFTVFDKIMVNGSNEISLYNYLKRKVQHSSLFSNFFSNSIKWNFTKFLCINGKPVKRYEPMDSFQKIDKDIEYYINN